jgi:acetylornithine deacetylase/succinyl-diaminopimelate desuccinylase-like protein
MSSDLRRSVEIAYQNHSLEFKVGENSQMRSTDYEQLENDVVSICQKLIQIPSVNFGEGNGNEKEIAIYVSDFLTKCRIENQIIDSAPNRSNVIARIKGADRNRPALVLHGHLDTVPANAEDWKHDPWSGQIIDGEIWGRGAVDIKDMDAMILAVVADWKRSGYTPPRDIVLAFFADEEAGSLFGSRWLVENRPELFENCSEAISEVGGFSATLPNGKRFYLIENAEKGFHWMRLISEGTAGHGSMINLENAITALSASVARIGTYDWPVRQTQTVNFFLGKVAEACNLQYDPEHPENIVAQLGSMARMIGATTRNTANPTMLESGYKANVIPQTASAVIDGRFLPGYEDEFMTTMHSLLNEGVRIETIATDAALEFPFEGKLVDAMCAAIISEDPEGIPVPYCMSGGTDNKALALLGITGFGFAPLKLPPDLDFMSLFHGINERVPVSSLKFGVRVLDKFLQNC